MSVTQVALCFALRYQFTLELLTGDLATNQACQCAKSSIYVSGINPVRFRSGRGCDLDTDPVPPNCHHLQNPIPRKGLGQWKRGMLP